MKRTIIVTFAGVMLVSMLLGTLLASILISAAPAAHANVDCYTQTTYNGGTRTTCYSGFPDYRTTVTTCDATHCVTTGR